MDEQQVEEDKMQCKDGDINKDEGEEGINGKFSADSSISKNEEFPIINPSLPMIEKEEDIISPTPLIVNEPVVESETNKKVKLNKPIREELLRKPGMTFVTFFCDDQKVTQ
jgi:hypothetical protein